MLRAQLKRMWCVLHFVSMVCVFQQLASQIHSFFFDPCLRSTGSVSLPSGYWELIEIARVLFPNTTHRVKARSGALKQLSAITGKVNLESNHPNTTRASGLHGRSGRWLLWSKHRDQHAFEQKHGAPTGPIPLDTRCMLVNVRPVAL